MILTLRMRIRTMETQVKPAIKSISNSNVLKIDNAHAVAFVVVTITNHGQETKPDNETVVAKKRTAIKIGKQRCSVHPYRYPKKKKKRRRKRKKTERRKGRRRLRKTFLFEARQLPHVTYNPSYFSLTQSS